MRYDIYVNPESLNLEREDTTHYGIEVQPPLDAMAAQGLCTLLSYKPKGFSTGREHLVESAIVTRNDGDGTVIMVERNPYVKENPTIIAERVGALIDPAGRHEIDTHTPEMS